MANVEQDIKDIEAKADEIAKDAESDAKDVEQDVKKDAEEVKTQAEEVGQHVEADVSQEARLAEDAVRHPGGAPADVEAGVHDAEQAFQDEEKEVKDDAEQDASNVADQAKEEADKIAEQLRNDFQKAQEAGAGSPHATEGPAEWANRTSNPGVVPGGTPGAPVHQV